MVRKLEPNNINLTFQLEVSFLLFTLETREDKVQNVYMFNKELRPVRHQGMYLLHQWYRASSLASLHFMMHLVQCRIISFPLVLSSVHRKFNSNA